MTGLGEGCFQFRLVIVYANIYALFLFYDRHKIIKQKQKPLQHPFNLRKIKM